MVTISVIVTVYNSEDSIQQVIKSIKDQTGVGSEFNLEVIVVDDCSTDNSYNLLKDLDVNLRSKLKIFILPQRAEVVSSRLNSHNSSFINSLINICKENQIDCSYPDLNSLSKLKESHFPVDGHLSIQGNHEVAKSLSLWVKTWR